MKKGGKRRWRGISERSPSIGEIDGDLAANRRADTEVGKRVRASIFVVAGKNMEEESRAEMRESCFPVAPVMRKEADISRKW